MSKSKFPHDKYPELSPKVCIRMYLVNGETGVRNGLLLAFPDPNNDDKYTIGYSTTHPSDKWSKTKAIQLALDRACTLSGRWPKVPWRIRRALPRFLVRCNRFFKGMSGPEWATNPKKTHVIKAFGYMVDIDMERAGSTGWVKSGSVDLTHDCNCFNECKCKINGKKSLVPSDFPVDKVERIE